MSPLGLAVFCRSFEGIDKYQFLLCRLSEDFEEGNGSRDQDKGQEIMRKIVCIAMLTTIVGLAGCDKVDTDLERAIVGAAIGCAAGEVLVDGKCVEGAIIGGAAGVVSDDF